MSCERLTRLTLVLALNTKWVNPRKARGLAHNGSSLRVCSLLLLEGVGIREVEGDADYMRTQGARGRRVSRKNGQQKGTSKANSVPSCSWSHPVWSPQGSGHARTHVPMKNDSDLSNCIEHCAKHFTCVISFKAHSTLQGRYSSPDLPITTQSVSSMSQVTLLGGAWVWTQTGGPRACGITTARRSEAALHQEDHWYIGKSNN